MEKKWRFLYFNWEDVVVYEACLKILMDECVSFDTRFEYSKYCTICFRYDDTSFESMKETMLEMYDYNLNAEEL